jgi:hypothetical protein
MICLSVRDMEDKDLLRSFWELKLHCIRRAFPSEKTCDDLIGYLKWIGKVAQAIFLRTKIPECPLVPVMVNDKLAPFDGPLRFMNEFYAVGRRNREFSMVESRACAQISNISRSLPYPSKDQVIESIKKSVKIFTTKTEVNAEALLEYRKGLQAQRTALGPLKKNKTHVSMVSSGSLESSRSHGGRSKVLISAARRFTDLLLDFESIKELIDKTDQFGIRILRSETVEMAKILLAKNTYSRVPTLGDILYLKVNEISSIWDTSLNTQAVPRELGHLLNLAASILMTENGYYNPAPKWTLGIMYFDCVLPRFTLQNVIRVRAGVSVESGLKARLTTSGSAAFAHLSQLPANLLREYLSKDPFMKIGFDESEKFWELLKLYERTTK